LNLDNRLDAILDVFPLDVSSTEPVEVGGLRRGTRVFKVDVRRSPLIPRGVYVGSPYIIDTLSGMEVACHPHIVGETLERPCLDCAGEFSKALVELDVAGDEGLAILHILRGASGYMMADTLPEVPLISVRTEYREDGYRAHTDDARSIRVTYNDYSTEGFEIGDVSTLLVPDTYATGRSAEAALHELFGAGLKPEKIVMYGFIAIPAMVRLGKICSGRGIELSSFSICDYSQLARNNYDMPLYGLDESLFRSTGELQYMGSIVDEETLKLFLPRYVAGLDQPGDWSERQTTMFDGHVDVEGDIVGHLRKSIGLVESLREINSGQPWYDDLHNDVALAELGRLRETLEEYE